MTRLSLSWLSEDYPHLAKTLADAAGQMPPGARGPSGIGPFQAPTVVEHHLLDAVEVSQNGRVTDLRRALRPVFPEGDIPDRVMAALAMLGACLAGTGSLLGAGRLAGRTANGGMNRSPLPTGSAK
ncbi:hypothetical protein [Gluconacetobacter tumulisoli]|uniref:Uncharacterized protein n=1 Tax=Gluconacetobacter tumulisoli TaxID=1286189 RepID=A0A7W4PQM6_9PROT|nr:hypothetical protein [Gluconacetobacter tumulisoli]MBB2202961.1 hypothetical protein [Gluconacetobacter tumulisoli]